MSAELEDVDDLTHYMQAAADATKLREKLTRIRIACDWHWNDDTAQLHRDIIDIIEED